MASLGIVRGQPFNPDERIQRIFDEGAKLGVAMCRAIVFASRSPESKYWPDRHWEKMFLYNTTFVRDSVADLDARTQYHYSAVVISPFLISTTPGSGTAYLATFRDNNGLYLNGNKNYSLHLLPNVPAKNFWAITAYDPTFSWCSGFMGRLRESLIKPGSLMILKNLIDNQVHFPVNCQKLL